MSVFCWVAGRNPTESGTAEGKQWSAIVLDGADVPPLFKQPAQRGARCAARDKLPAPHLKFNPLRSVFQQPALSVSEVG